uniref:NADH-ubiquinone oxidoreductase chain 6 n=1 Tax=Mertensiella caucasica TaxID=111425 RepID=B8R6W3_9SALA|nr:NADH dehydrogenase subunit 6 [Mertensiella caucasica]
MTLLSSVFIIGVVVGVLAVASNPSPYYAAFGLVLASFSGCCLLVELGVCFLSLILVLVYMGGMMVVFAYAASFSAEPFPEAWGSWSVLAYMTKYFVIISLVGVWLLNSNFSVELIFGNYSLTIEVVGCDWGGAGIMYVFGGLLLLAVGWVLLLTLLVVLEVTRGASRGALRVE